MLRWPLILLFILALPLAGANSPSKAVCPSGKDILGSAVPKGQFAKTAWTLFDVKRRKIMTTNDGLDRSNSILLFSEETVDADNIRVKGYFWWRLNGNINGCSQVAGDYDTKNRVLTLETLKISAKHLVANMRYKATLSDDGNTLDGTMRGFNNQDYFFFQGTWKARKLDLEQAVDDPDDE